MITQSLNAPPFSHRRAAWLARGLGAAALLAAGVAHAEAPAPETLECDVQFEVQNYLKDSYLLQPSKDLPASVPTSESGQRPFESYRLEIDWKKRSAEVHTTAAATGAGSASGPVTYAITSEPSAEVIQLEAGASAPAKGGAFPSRFFIRRLSGWFMRLEPLASKPSTGFTEVGVCGRDQKL